MMDDTRWVFGYGSLMWRPGFAHTDRQPAHLTGLHRSLCVYSYVHRGTPNRPGLVLGLNHGGACRGVAFKVADADWPDVVAYLRGQLDGIWDGLSPAQQADAADLFARAVACERAFFDASYAAEPVVA